jgi:hypothetical protein
MEDANGFQTDYGPVWQSIARELISRRTLNLNATKILLSKKWPENRVINILLGKQLCTITHLPRLNSLQPRSTV